MLEIESDKDHIHFLIQYSPNQCIGKLVKLFKQITTKRIWDNYEKLMKINFWKRKILWSNGYYVSSIGKVSETTIRKYINEQG